MSNVFFECNVPLVMPSYMDPSVEYAYVTAAEKITERHEKLQTALEISGLKPESFQLATSGLFRSEENNAGNVDHFDRLSASDLASYANLVCVPDNKTEDRINWVNANVICDTAYATNEEWANILRSLGIGGSESAVIQGISPYSTRRKVYRNKKGIRPVEKASDRKTAVFTRGHFLEDAVIASFCKRTGAVRIRDTRMFQSKRYPHNIADIDAILRMPTDEIFIFEAKTTIMDNRDAWKEGKIPGYYVVQTRHYAGVLDDPRVQGTYIGCHFTHDLDVAGDYVGSEFREDKFLSRLIERDEEREEEILSMNESFWNEYIEPGTEPEMSDNSELEMEIYKEYVRESDYAPMVRLEDSEKDAAREYISIGREISRLDAEKKSLQSRRDRLKCSFIEKLGTAAAGKIQLSDGNYYEVINKPVFKDKVDIDTLRACFPEAYGKCVTEDEEAYRTFTIKEKDERGRLVKDK